jgi:hypothetical protein
VGDPLLLQLSIALFTGMVAATLVPPVRAAIPKPIEIMLWVALVCVCLLGVAGITDANARELSASAAWGADQIINTLISLMLGGVATWILEHRFAIASWLVLVAGADIFALMFLGSLRSAQPWQPRVRLREWMELPVAGSEAATARHRAVPADPLADVNRRLAAASALAGAALLAGMRDLTIWIRDVLVPRQAPRLADATATGRIGTRDRLDSLRDATAHLSYAARAWCTVAGEPAFNGLAARTAWAAKRGLKPVVQQPGDVIDIRAPISAQSIGWYGPPAGPNLAPGELDVAESERSDRLAS